MGIDKYKGEHNAGFDKGGATDPLRQAQRPSAISPHQHNMVTGHYNDGYVIPNDHTLRAHINAPSKLITGQEAVDLLVGYAQRLIKDNSSIFHPGGGALGEERFWQSSQLGGEVFGRWEVSELSGVGSSQWAALRAFFGVDTSETGDNALTNFFGTIGREFQRNEGKGGITGKFGVNNILLHLQNPNIANPDVIPSKTLGALLKGAIFGTKTTSVEVPGAFRGNVAARTKRAGPSFLSIIPAPSSFNLGKGKLFNIAMPLVGGASATFGEQMLPLTGLTIDKLSGREVTDPIAGYSFGDLAKALLKGLLNNASDRRDEDNLEPYATVATFENPLHLATAKGKRVFETVGKNQWQIKGLPNNLILRDKGPAGSTGTKPYSSENKIDRQMIANIERELEKEYVPFYFHDMRTNEVIAFHAFLKSLNETYGPQWNSESYYGRVDNVQTYGGNTSRRITLSFTVAALNRIDYDIMWKKVNKLVTLTYPQFGERLTSGEGKKKITIPHSAPMIGAPVCRMRIGDLIKTNLSIKAIANEIGQKPEDVAKNILTHGDINPGAEEKMSFVADFSTYSKGLAGVITDITFDYNTSTWETAMNHVAPQFIDVSLSFTAIHDIAPGLDANGVNRAPLYTPFAPGDDPSKQNALLSGDEAFGNSTGAGTLNKSMGGK